MLRLARSSCEQIQCRDARGSAQPGGGGAARVLRLGIPSMQIPGGRGSAGQADMAPPGCRPDCGWRDTSGAIVSSRRCSPRCPVSQRGLSAGVGVPEAPGHSGPLSPASMGQGRARRCEAAVRLTLPWRWCGGPGDPAVSAAVRGRPRPAAPLPGRPPALPAAWGTAQRSGPALGLRGACTWLLPSGGAGGETLGTPALTPGLG